MTVDELKLELLETYKKIEPAFVKKSLPFNMNVKWAALRMEIFFICGLCEHFGCNKVIESGTGLGFSALMFERYFRGTGINIVTVDNEKRKSDMFDNTVDPVQYVIGDGHKVIPELIEKNKEKKICLFIDGPKGNDAYKIANASFEYDNVPFAVIHDEGPSSIQRGTPKQFEGRTICSWQPWFRDKYIYMDQEAVAIFEEKKFKKIRWGLPHIMEMSKECGQGALCVLSPKTMDLLANK